MDSEPTAEDILAALNQALRDIHDPPPYSGPVCHCGSITWIDNHGLAFPGKRNGFYCHQGHRLPGQDMLSTNLR